MTPETDLYRRMVDLCQEYGTTTDATVDLINSVIESIIFNEEGDSMNVSDSRPTITITREQLEAWAGRDLTDEEVADLDNAIPNSSIPEAVGEIAHALHEETK